MTDMESTLETERKTEQGGMPKYEPADHEAEEKAKDPVVKPTGTETTDPSFDK